MALERNLLPFGFGGFRDGLSLDSLIAAATKAYYIDEKRIEEGARRIEEQTNNL